MKENELNPVEVFAGYHLNHYFKCNVPPFHREMYEMAYRNEKRIAIAAPRSFAKSTVFSVIYPLYKIYESDVSSIILISETSSLAEKWLRKIKDEMSSNQYLIGDYGVVNDQTATIWRNDIIVFKHPVTGRPIEIEAKGAGKQIRGTRPDLIIVDDLENDLSVRSEEQRERLASWFDKALINTLERDSQLIMIGTVLHPLSLLANVLEREGWITKKYQALLPDGESLWPEKWPKEELLSRKNEIGHLAFQSEFMNDPIISENPLFVREWFEEYSPQDEAFITEIGKGVYTVTAIDPAISRKEGSDYTAIVTVSATFGDKPKYYIRNATRGHWTVHEQVHKLSDEMRRFKSNRVLIETVAYQQALSQIYQAYCEENRLFFSLEEIKPDRDKERRAHSIASMIQGGDVFFDYSNPVTHRLMDEMVVFPTGDHDDLVDALVYCLQHLQVWGKRERSSQDKPYIVLPGKGTKNKHTGVV